MKTVQRVSGWVIAVSIMFLSSHPAPGAPFRWSGTDAVENWHDGSNWTNGAPPGSADEAEFVSYAYTGTVKVTNNTDVLRMYITGGSAIDLTLDMYSGTGPTTLRVTFASQSLYFEGNANLTITNGTLALEGHPYIRPWGGGITVTKDGFLDVVGASTLFRFGRAVPSDLVVKEGGRLEFDNYLYLGAESTAGGHELVVDGPGSFCGGGYYLYVDYVGGDNCSVIVTNGGELSLLRRITVGSAPAGGADGNTVLVTGAGSKLEAGAWSSYIGEKGSSNTLTVTDSAYAHVTGNLDVGRPDYPAGIDNALIVKDGGVLVCNGIITAYSNALIEIDGGAITSGTITVYQTAELKGRGNVTGTTALNLNGTLTVGDPTGVLTFVESDLTFGPNAVANFTFTSAAFEPGTYGVVQDTAAAGEDVAFDGTLNLTIVGAQQSTTVQIFDFDGYSGDFDQVNVYGADASATFNATDGTVTLAPLGTVILVR